MDTFNLYQDIKKRTGGNVYIGVVGPVRTGKSTFIRKFMDGLVLPGISDGARAARIVDELPQSADGKTIMTTQPKFVPDGGVEVFLDESTAVNVRLIDCVGYVVSGAEGFKEGDKARMVKTPWSDEEMEFEAAAEFGTRKVIRDHSTIGIVITADGSFTSMPRSAYEDAEGRVICELQEMGKPFITLLNTSRPNDKAVAKMCADMREKYGCIVVAVDVLSMSTEDIKKVLSEVLMQFPVTRIDCDMPKWMRSLPYEHPVITRLMSCVYEASEGVCCMRDYVNMSGIFADDEYFMSKPSTTIDFGTGVILINAEPKSHLYYEILSEQCDVEINDDHELFEYIKKCSYAEMQYGKLKDALAAAQEGGYGVVAPTESEMTLEEPELIKKGNKMGVKLRAKVPTLHIMRIDVECEVKPLGGGNNEEIAGYLMSEYEDDKQAIWQANMFGKTLDAIAKESLDRKINGMPYEAQRKLRKTVGRIVNEGKGGILCVLL